MKSLLKLKNWQVKIANNNRFILIIVCIMMTTYLFANTVCIPALPAIREHFKTSVQNIQNIVILYTFGLGISQLMYGPLADQCGRRRIILLGTTILLIGSLITLVAHTIKILLAGRLLQGIGAGCYSVVGKSITSDIYKNNQYVNATVAMMIFSVLTQIIAPVMGGYLTVWFSWYANLIAISLYTIITFLIVLLLLPETGYIKQSSASMIKTIKSNYHTVSHIPQFWILTVVSAVTLSAITIYQIMSPFILQIQLGMSPIAYGWAALLTAGGFLMGNCSIPLLKNNLNLMHKIYLGLAMMSLGALAMTLLNIMHCVTPLAIILPMCLFNMGTGIVFPVATAGALLQQSMNAGSAAALIGALQMILVAGISVLNSRWILQTPSSLAIALVLMTGICVIASNLYKPQVGESYEISQY